MKNRSKITLLLIALFIAIGISACAAAGDAGPAAAGSTPAAETLTREDAKAAALEHAGLTAGQVSHLRAEYDVDDGIAEYDIEFRCGDYEYEYTVNAKTGKILSHSKEYDPEPTAPAPTDPSTDTVAPTAPENTAGPMLQSEAEAIVLNHAGLTADQVTGLRTELDERWEYEVEFRHGDYEYDYTVHAVTGAILEHDKEYDPKPVAPTEPTVAPTEPERLTAEEAKAIALDHAGFTADQVRELEAELDFEGGIPVYEVDFEAGKWEYSYEIHAETGEILSWEKDD